MSAAAKTDTPAARRVKVVIAGLFLLVLGIGLLGFGISDLSVLIRGLGEHRAVVASEPRAASAISLGIMALSIGALFLLSRPTDPGPRRRDRKAIAAEKRMEKWSGRYLIFLLACILFALFAPMVQRAVVGSVVAGRGYVPCPPITWPRHQPDRWALSGARDRCPGEGASPNS